MAFQVIFNICIDLYFKIVQMHKQVYHWIHSKFCFNYSFIISKPWNTGYSWAILIWWDLNSNYHSVEILRDVSLCEMTEIKRERKLGSRRSRLGRCYLWFIASQRHCPFWGQLSEPITWAANAVRLITIYYISFQQRREQNDFSLLQGLQKLGTRKASAFTICHSKTWKTKLESL